MQFTRNIGDRRLLEPDFPEQAFRDLDNQLMSVLFIGFSFVRIFRPSRSRERDYGVSSPLPRWVLRPMSRFFSIPPKPS